MKSAFRGLISLILAVGSYPVEAIDEPKIGICGSELRDVGASARYMTKFLGMRLRGSDVILIGDRPEDVSISADDQIKEGVIFIRHSNIWHAYALGSNYKSRYSYQENHTRSVALVTELDSGDPSPTVTIFLLDAKSGMPVCTTLKSLASTEAGGRDYSYSNYDGFNMTRSGIATLALSGMKSDSSPTEHFTYTSRDRGRSWGKLVLNRRPSSLRGDFKKSVPDRAYRPWLSDLLKRP